VTGGVAIHNPTTGAMRIAVFSSGGPGNFQAALDCARANPSRLQVALLVTDRPQTASESVARELGIPVVTRDFPATLAGTEPLQRARRCDQLHEELLEEIQSFERQRTAIDLCVLAYRRLVRGPLLDRFRGRMINQHPADLTSFDVATRKRRYTGIGGLKLAISDGNPTTRTSTMLVDDGVDTGEILVQGPSVAVEKGAKQNLDQHERKQKSLSDWPALSMALQLISTGRLSVGTTTWPDGCRRIYRDGVPLPYGGVQL